MVPSNQEKRQLRLRLRSIRQNLEPNYRYTANQQINEHLFAWKTFQEAKVVHVFLSLPEEVQTQTIIETCWREGKQVVVPFTQPHTKILGHSWLKSLEHLHPGHYNILEPRQEVREDVDLSRIDLVLVPGLGFDPTGMRLGYGGGHYDRFLPLLSAYFLGVTFESQVVENITRNPHDVMMDGLLTETGISEIVD